MFRLCWPWCKYYSQVDHHYFSTLVELVFSRLYNCLDFCLFLHVCFPFSPSLSFPPISFSSSCFSLPLLLYFPFLALSLFISVSPSLPGPLSLSPSLSLFPYLSLCAFHLSIPPLSFALSPPSVSPSPSALQLSPCVSLFPSPVFVSLYLFSSLVSPSPSNLSFSPYVCLFTPISDSLSLL